MRRVIIGLAAAALAGPAFAIPPPVVPPAPQGAVLITPELKANTPPAALADLLLGEAASRMVETRAGAFAIEFLGRPAKAPYADVCQVESIFASLAQETRANPPPPYVQSLAIGLKYRARPADGCAALPPGTLYFTAPNAQAAERAIQFLDQAAAGARADGRPPFAIACSRGDCGDARRLLAGLSSASLQQVTERSANSTRAVHRAQLVGHGYVDVTLKIEPDMQTMGPPVLTLLNVDLKPPLP